MKQLIRHILRERTREIEEYAKSTTPEFIRDAKKVHGKKYDYSETEYENAKTKVKIICPKHGEFLQNPKNHLNGSGCPKCRTSKSSTEEFIEKAKKKHGNKYDYSKVVYDGGDSQISIICPIHGLFKQRAAAHLFGSACPKCWQDRNKNSTEEFIKQAKKIHGNKFDYSKVDYKNNYTKVEIICPIHGEFSQIPSNHLLSQGCPKCGIEKMKQSLTSNTKDFIKRAKGKHGNKFDYSKSVYTKATDPIIINCPIHGEFETTPVYHLELAGGGCNKCSNTYRRNNDEFIELAKKVHNNKYSYENTNFVNMRTPVTISCPKHGEFLQGPSPHLKGQGCPVCNESSGELFIYNLLKNNSVDFKREKKFQDCFHKSETGRCTPLEFDFYIPTMNTCIEYDGKQHFEPIAYYGGEEGFKKSVKRDKIKNQYCKKNGIKLIRIPYTMKKEEIEPYILKELGIK